MPLESLKERVMQQAKEKGFGTTPDDIDVAQKLLLVMDEGMEVTEAAGTAWGIYNQALSLYDRPLTTKLGTTPAERVKTTVAQYPGFEEWTSIMSSSPEEWRNCWSGFPGKPE